MILDRVTGSQPGFGNPRKIATPGDMMNGAFPTKCSGCSYQGRHIYVVGSMHFERELLIKCIGPHTAAQWFEADSLQAVPVSNQNVPHGLKMILIDTRTQDRESLLSLFATNSWKSHSQNLMVLFNLMHDFDIEKDALKSGVRGFLYADDPVKDLINGICAINSGDIWVSRRILRECLEESSFVRDIPEPTDHSLSRREIELLRHLSSGASNDAIADQLCISPHTVKTHLHNIFHKINVENRIQAVLWAKDNL
jgi:DNA-binding NarL/FixJ family response regulator